MEIPNVVDMIFGRIDRNTDVKFRDKSLNQNQKQFEASQALDRERLTSANEQFFKRLAFDKAAQDATQQAALVHAINQGLVDTEGGGPVSTSGGMNNMFMPSNGSAPGMAGLVSPGPRAILGGQSVRARTRPELFAQSLSEEGQMAKQKYVAAQQHKANTVNFLTESGVPPILASMAAENPNILPQLVNDPKVLVGIMSSSKTVPKAVVDAMVGGMQSATNAGIPNTPATLALTKAQTNNQNAQASWHAAQAGNMKPPSPEGAMLYNQAVAEASKQYTSADPRFMGAVHAFINNATAASTTKQDAVALAVKDINQRVMGETFFQSMERLNNNKGAVNPTITVPAPPATNQPTTGPGAVNNKPPTVTGPNQVVRPNPFPNIAPPPPTGTPGSISMDEFLKQLMTRPPQQ